MAFRPLGAPSQNIGGTVKNLFSAFSAKPISRGKKGFLQFDSKRNEEEAGLGGFVRGEIDLAQLTPNITGPTVNLPQGGAGGGGGSVTLIIAVVALLVTLKVIRK